MSKPHRSPRWLARLALVWASTALLSPTAVAHDPVDAVQKAIPNCVKTSPPALDRCNVEVLDGVEDLVDWLDGWLGHCDATGPPSCATGGEGLPFGEPCATSVDACYTALTGRDPSADQEPAGEVVGTVTSHPLWPAHGFPA